MHAVLIFCLYFVQFSWWNAVTQAKAKTIWKFYWQKFNACWTIQTKVVLKATGAVNSYLYYKCAAFFFFKTSVHEGKWTIFRSYMSRRGKGSVSHSFQARINPFSISCPARTLTKADETSLSHGTSTSSFIGILSSSQASHYKRHNLFSLTILLFLIGGIKEAS